MEKKKLGFISFAYAIGCILVVLGHSYPLGNAVTPKWMDIVRTAIYIFHMPLFFFISGFLLKFSGSVKKRGYWSFLVQKAKQLLVPYVFLSLLGYVPKLLVSSYISDKVELSAGYVVRSLLVPRENIWGHFWFIPTLFIIYVFAATIITLASKRSDQITMKVLPPVILLMSLAMHHFPIRTGWFSLQDVYIYSIYVALGYFSCDLVKDRKLDNRWIAALCAAVFFGFVVLRANASTSGSFALIPAVCMIYLVLAAGKAYERRGSTFLHFLEGKTFTVFLFSWPFQAVVEVLLNKVLHLNWYVVFLCMFAAGIAMPLLIYQVASRLPAKVRRYSWIIGIQEA